MDNSNNEIWKDIIGFEQYYQVSNLGRVRSKDRIVITPKTSYFKKGRILIPSLDSKGNYLFVGLHVNNKVKLIYIHRLVAQNFIPNPHNYKQVNHINENKKDNRADNLEWCTAEYNMNYGTAMQRAKETYASRYDRSAIAKNNAIKKKVIQYTLDGKYIKEWDSLTDIQNELGFCRRNISKCCEGKYKQANNFIWKFKKD